MTKRMLMMLSITAFLVIMLIGLMGSAFAQEVIIDKCPDYCDAKLSILYLNGKWDSLFRRCVYEVEEKCKYGCELASTSKIYNSKPRCKDLPDVPPENETDYEETLWSMVRELLKEKRSDFRIDIHGTEYSPYERGKVFLQLLDGDNLPINNSYCYCSIYYPDGFSKWKDEQFMTYSDEGLYFYPFTTPVRRGVYMVSAYCVIPQPNITLYESTDGFESGGTSGGSGDWDDDWYLDGNANIGSYSPHTGSYELRLRGGNGYADRPATSSDLVDRVVVSFWARANSLEDADHGYFTFCGNNDTSNCTTLEEWTNGDDDDVWHYYTYTLLKGNYNWSEKVWLEFDTTGFSGSGDYLYIDDVSVKMLRDEYNSTEYQFVRGSGEVVVRENLPYRYEFTDGYVNISEGDEFGGTAYLNLTITSLVSQNTSVDISIRGFDYYYCTDIIEFKVYNGSSWENVTDFVCDYDSDEGQSIMTFTQSLEPSTVYQYYFKLRSKWFRNFYNILDSVNETDDTLYGICNYYFNKTNQTMPDIPLNASHTELVHGYSQIAKWCVQGLDILWHIQEKEQQIDSYNYSYGSNTSLVAMFQLLEALKELDDHLYPEYRNYYDMITWYFGTSALYSNNDATQDFFNGTYNPFYIFGNSSTPNFMYRYVQGMNHTLYLVNETVFDIKDYQLNELSNNLTEIIAYLSEINDTTGDTIVAYLKEINETLYNLTIGNITVSAYVNWTEGTVKMNNISNPVVVESQLMTFAGRDQTPVQTISHTYCIDNTTLAYDINITRCWLDQCFTINETITEICDYGCYNNKCNPEPFNKMMFLALIFIGAMAVIVAIAFIYDRFAK